MSTVVEGRDDGAALVLRAGARWSRAVVGLVLVTSLAVAVGSAILTSPVPSWVVPAVTGAGLLAGLPHGSVDHRLAANLTRRPVLPVAAAYGAAAVLAWALMSAVGLAAIVAVVVLSVVHFGRGELEAVRETGWHPSTAVAVSVAVAGSGALLLPLARAGDLLDGVASSISPGLGDLLGAPALRITLVATWLLAAMVTVVVAARTRRWGAVLDVALVGALGALAPPLLAFAVWFGGWHSVRHCARLLTVDEHCAVLVSRAQVRQAMLDLARQALWPTAAALVTLAVLVVLTSTATDPAAAIGRTLVVLLALTVPHMMVVCSLDARREATR